MNENILKTKIKEKYAKIARSGNSESCCSPECCSSSDFDPKDSSFAVGYDQIELESIPESANLGLGCGAPLNFSNLKEGETVVDLGSGAGIDLFLASKHVGNKGKVIGIDFTDDMLSRARDASSKYGFINTDFRKADIEKRIPVEDNTVDAVISNCVINLTSDKVRTFKEIYRILKKEGKGRMIVSDLVTSKEVRLDDINAEKWSSCIDGALTRENYIKAIKQAGFEDIKVLNEQEYIPEYKTDGRTIVSLVIGAVTRK